MRSFRWLGATRLFRGSVGVRPSARRPTLPECCLSSAILSSKDGGRSNRASFVRRSFMVRATLLSAVLLAGGSVARDGVRPVHRLPSTVITAIAARSSRLNCTKSLMAVVAMLSQFVAFCRFETTPV